jgi:NAD(P)-dependent dehydrogenase (short-subunit alcohol dehydrogenase family)
MGRYRKRLRGGAGVTKSYAVRSKDFMVKGEHSTFQTDEDDMILGFTDKDVPDMSGKTALVTGANSGVGFETTKTLAARGAKVLLACRSSQKADDAIALIKQGNKDADISFIELDLGSLASVKEAAAKINKLAQLDLLINNAGIMIPPFELTVDGFESQFGVNHLGPFALTGQLLDTLKTTPGSRIINTSSIAHSQGKILFDDINAENGYKAMERYSMSKLANLLFSRELDRRLRAAKIDVASIACHPGVATTELSRHLPTMLQHLNPLLNTMFNTPAKGAWPTLQAATDPKAEGGQYYGPMKRKETAGPSRPAKIRARGNDMALANRLWEISAEITGISYL